MLVGLRIAEIGEYTVAHVFRHEPTMALDQLVTAAVIDGNDAPQVLWVEPSRKRGRAYKIAKHDRKLAALSLRKSMVCWIRLFGDDGGHLIVFSRRAP